MWCVLSAGNIAQKRIEGNRCKGRKGLRPYHSCLNESQLMKKNLMKLLVLALFAVWVSGARAEEDVMIRTFPAKAGGTLTVNVDRGSIHITTSDADKVEVKITREL